MRTTSLADAKARLSELVDAAEHRGQRIVILRNGKPAAAIVPFDVVAEKRRRPMPREEAEKSVLAFVEEFSSAESSVSAVEDLIEGRR
jgi:prevent-host-death family protein